MEKNGISRREEAGGSPYFRSHLVTCSHNGREYVLCYKRFQYIQKQDGKHAHSSVFENGSAILLWSNIFGGFEIFSVNSDFL